MTSENHRFVQFLGFRRTDQTESRLFSLALVVAVLGPYIEALNRHPAVSVRRMLEPKSCSAHAAAPGPSSNMETSRFQFKVHSFDSDAFGNLTAPRLLGYLIESACGSADSLGFGIGALNQLGLTWVMGRIRIELDASLRVGDALTVETWPSGIKRAVAMRDFRIERSGQLVGAATSQWFVLDVGTRLPIRPHRLLPERLHPETEHLVGISAVIQAFEQPATVRREFDVRLSDIDLNQHVTAASYIDWAMQGLTEDLWRSHRLSGMDVQFLEECLLGSRIATESLELEGPRLLHRISRSSDQKELARLATTWVPR